MSLPKVVVVGAGGHAQSVADAIIAAAENELVGYLDPDPAKWGQLALGAMIIGDDSQVENLLAEGVRLFALGVGSIGDPGTRTTLASWFASAGLKPLQVIHPRAIVSTFASLEEGAQVLGGAVVNPNAHVGRFAIVNTGAIVEHDCVIGEFAHVATGACMGGSCVVGPGAHIGAGATLRQGTIIGERALVGAGAVVVSDVPPGAKVIGVPAKPMQASKNPDG